jgi:hypothetical protein
MNVDSMVNQSLIYRRLTMFAPLVLLLFFICTCWPEPVLSELGQGTSETRTVTRVSLSAYQSGIHKKSSLSPRPALPLS